MSCTIKSIISSDGLAKLLALCVFKSLLYPKANRTYKLIQVGGADAISEVDNDKDDRRCQS